MSQRNLTGVLLKVLGVVSIIKAVDFSSNALVVLSSVLGMHGKLSALDILQTFLPTLLPFAIYLLTAFILIRYAEAIAAKLFPIEASAFASDSVPTDEWYVFAFTVLGVILLVWFVPGNIVVSVDSFLRINDESWGQFQPQLWRSAWNMLIRVVLQLGLGLYLILGSRTIVTILRKLRHENIR